MARREVIHTVIALAAFFTSASAVPMMPFGPGMWGGSLLGGHGNIMMNSHIGASYRDGTSFNSAGDTIIAPMQSPTVLNGVSRLFSQADNSLVEGIAVTIKPATPDHQNSHMAGSHGAMGYGSPFGLGGGKGGLLGGFGGLGLYGGLSPGLMGSAYGLGGHGGGGGGLFGQPEQLEAVVEVIRPADFVSKSALIVFTESAITSTTDNCPVGPILTEPVNSRQSGDFGGLGFAHAGSMLGGYGGSPMGLGMGMGVHSGPNFGVVAEVTLQPGLNTFTVQGLGLFNRIRQLGGHGLSVCKNVHIGMDGQPGCTEVVFGCVKLGFTSTPERLVPPVPVPAATVP